MLNTAIIGVGKRARNLYIPILQKFSHLIKIKALCNRTKEKAENIARFLNIPCYSSTNELLENENIDFAIITTDRNNHLEPVISCINNKIAVLLETPLADKIEDMKQIIEAAEKTNVFIDVAENYFNRPMELLKRKMVQNGIFGKINLIFSNFVCHGYHALALMRSYFNFSIKPVNIIPFKKEFSVLRHIWREGYPERETELFEHAVIEFDNGSVGVYSFSSLTYGSPMRIEPLKNEVVFYAEKGMAKGDDLVIVENNRRRFIKVEKIYKNIDGIDVLQKITAKTDPEIIWDNPLKDIPIEESELDVALTIFYGIDTILKKEKAFYGVNNAMIDRKTEIEIIGN